MGHWARGEAWIPFDEWYDFIKKYIPQTDGELSFGEPRPDADCIVVPFALNTECNPAEEADPPEWLKRK